MPGVLWPRLVLPVEKLQVRVYRVVMCIKLVRLHGGARGALPPHGAAGGGCSCMWVWAWVWVWVWVWGIRDRVVVIAGMH